MGASQFSERALNKHLPLVSTRCIPISLIFNSPLLLWPSPIQLAKPKTKLLFLSLFPFILTAPSIPCIYNSINSTFSNPISCSFSIFKSSVHKPRKGLSKEIFFVFSFTFISGIGVMGNYVSCTLSGSVGKGKNSSRATKVIFPNGEIRRFHKPMKAAELMLEMPNFFLVNTQALKIGKRFSPLSADEDLEMNDVYVFFPMKRLNSAVTAADMGSLFLAAKRVSIGSGRVLPECGGDSQIAQSDENCWVPKLNLDDIEEFSTPEFRHKLSMCRSKKPLLETIVEETVNLRFMLMIES